MVGSRSQIAGANVALAHRLLKNGLAGRRAYVLLTDAALRWMEIDPGRTGFTAHSEGYKHFGNVRYFVRDLAGPVLHETPGRAASPEPSLAAAAP
jgi:hypothetical protein